MKENNSNKSNPKGKSEEYQSTARMRWKENPLKRIDDQPIVHDYQQWPSSIIHFIQQIDTDKYIKPMIKCYQMGYMKVK
jgi:hypothetical protein